MSEVGVLSPALRNRKKPHKPMFTGRSGGRGGGRWLSQLSVWPFGCVVDVEGRCFVAIVHENEIKSCKPMFTGLVLVSRAHYISLGRFQPICSLSRVVRRGGTSRHEIESKHKKKSKSRGSQTPTVFPVVFFVA